MAHIRVNGENVTINGNQLVIGERHSCHTTRETVQQYFYIERVEDRSGIAVQCSRFDGSVIGRVVLPKSNGAYVIESRREAGQTVIQIVLRRGDNITVIGDL